MRMCSIASGSSGNCIYIGSEDHHILIDAGVSCKRMEQGLKSLGLTPADIDAVVLTHEHSDHIKGLGVAARKYGIPVYATDGTTLAVKSMKNLGEIDGGLFHSVRADRNFRIGDLEIFPFYVSHDAAEPVAYRVECAGRSAAVATDLGVYTDYTIDHLRDVDVLLLEANHDIRMLEAGRYPYYLKSRIAGELGHLSNETAGKLLCRLLHDCTRHIFLGHLSKENNYPELAYETVKLEISFGDTPYGPADFPIDIAPRDMPAECVEF